MPYAKASGISVSQPVSRPQKRMQYYVKVIITCFVLLKIMAIFNRLVTRVLLLLTHHGPFVLPTIWYLKASPGAAKNVEK